MPLVPSYIKNLSSYKPGLRIDDVKYEKGLDRAIKLASNENSMGPAPLAIAAIESAMKKVNRYPDSNGIALRTKLAKKFDVKIYTFNKNYLKKKILIFFKKKTNKKKKKKKKKKKTY